MQAIGEALRGLWSSKIYVRETIEFQEDEDIPPEKLEGFIFTSWLTVCEKDFEVDPDLSTEVRRGMHGMSFKDAIKDEIKLIEKSAEKRSLNLSMSIPLDDLERSIDAFLAAVGVWKIRARQAIGGALRTITKQRDKETGFFGETPTMIDAKVYGIFKAMMFSPNKALAAITMERIGLQNFCVHFETYCYRLQNPY